MVLGRTMRAIGILVAGLVGGAILWGLGHWLIGLFLVCGAIPVALTAWIIYDGD